MPIAHINGVDIYYELHGKGKPLVLIAGYTSDHSFWDEMLPGLARHFQVLIFDNRGIGQSTDNHLPFSVEDMAADTMGLIKHLGLKQACVLGQSMGGTVAQIVAKKYPEVVDRLVILNSTAKINMRTLKAIESLLNLRAASISLDLLLDASLPWFWSREFLAKSEDVESYKNMVKNYPYPQSLENQERQLKALRAFDSRTWVHEIKVPTLVIAAKEDIVVRPEESQMLASAIPNAQFMMIAKAHASPAEQTEELNEMLLKFLR